MNSSDERQVRKAEKNAKFIEANRMFALRDVLSTRAGRDVLWWFMEEMGVHRSVWSSDPGLMAYNSGRQDMGHFLEGQIIMADEKAFLQMIMDNKKLAEEESKGEDNDGTK